MGANGLFIAGLVIFDGAAVAWAAWEFWSIRKGKAEALIDAEADAPQLSEHPSGHLEGEHGADGR
jgi:hypothetical protein